MQPSYQHIDPRYAQQYQQPYPQQPQPQYGAPQGTPWLPQQYGGAPAGQPPAQPAQPPAQPAQPPQFGGQMPPTAAPKLGESGKGGGGAKAPAPRHLVGRTVILEPVSIDENRMAKNDKTGEMEKRPMATYHLTVVDGGPLQYGDNKSNDPREQHGMTFETSVPARFTNVQTDRWGIVQEIRDTMARGEMASVGVIERGTKGNFPFLMTKCAMDLDRNDRPDGAQRFEAATQVWNAIFAKTFVSPEPRSLVAPPARQPPQVAYQPYQQQAPAGYAQQQYAQTGTVPTPYGAAPAQQLHPEYVAAATQPTYNPGPPQGYMTPDGPAVYGSVQAAYAPPQPQSAPPTPPSAQQGYGQNPAFEAWLATLPPEQQAAQRAAMQGLPVPGTQQPAGPGF